MTRFFLTLFDFFHKRKSLCFVTCTVLVAMFAAMTATLDYKEDIHDFLPFDANHKKEMEVYQKIAQSDRVVVIFEMRDTTAIAPDRLAEAINRFEEIVIEKDTSHHFRDLITNIDYDQIQETTGFIYRHIPLFLTENDYKRIDSTLTTEYIATQVAEDRTLLMLPTGSLLSDNIQRDPLNLFTPTVARLQTASPSMRFDTVDGYIFTEGQRRAFAFFSTPYGPSETANNQQLAQQLDNVMHQIEEEMTDVKVHSVGAPIIAVGNAQQIKQDSLLAVCIAVTFILALLLYSFRSLKSLVFISVSILVGWLFAMACLSIVRDSVSIIVIGIASVIIGIAVNYPLHLAAHLRHEPDMRQALKEIISPLLIGNITTVGAFLCLVPMEAIAMRDLGMFGAFMLIGTILFVVIFLPHMISSKTTHSDHKPRHDMLAAISNISLDSRWVIWPVIILTTVLAWFSLDTSFDTDISHINYMTDEQRADMLELQDKMTDATTVPVYIVSEGNTWSGALEKSEHAQATLDSIVTHFSKTGIYGTNMAGNQQVVEKHSATHFLPSLPEQTRRIAMWNRLIADKGELLTTMLYHELEKQGFDPTSFTEYDNIIHQRCEHLQWDELEPLASRLFPTNISHDSTGTTVVDVLQVPRDDKDAIISHLNERLTDCHVFDVQGMNSSLAHTLSDDFNYIGFSCSIIVFAFLWLSFGSLELAIISFIPMAISWIWILGLMSLLGMQFNIVNIILATFIFGQGDDYTIFMTEGASYEYAYRRRMLSSYKQSIIISALIMFIGIGSLIVARHPALLSLAEVTIVGMFSVVLMAYMFPPLIFRWLTTYRGRQRSRPITIASTLSMGCCVAVFFTQLMYGVIHGFIWFVLQRPTTAHRMRAHEIVHHIFKWNAKHLPNVRYVVNNIARNDFSRPSIIIANHQSFFDSVLLIALTPRIIILGNQRSSVGRVTSLLFRWLEFVTIDSYKSFNIEHLKRKVAEGYSIAIFPEGRRNHNPGILRFHQGAFRLASELGLSITPVFIHGVRHVLPDDSIGLYSGRITVTIDPTIAPPSLPQPCTDDNHPSSVSHSLWTREVNRYYRERFAEISANIETPDYLKPIILDRYRYKGTEILSSARRSLQAYQPPVITSAYSDTTVHLTNVGIGASAILTALTHPTIDFIASDPVPDNITIAQNCADGIPNLRWHIG